MALGPHHTHQKRRRARGGGFRRHASGAFLHSPQSFLSHWWSLKSQMIEPVGSDVGLPYDCLSDLAFAIWLASSPARGRRRRRWE